MKENHIIKDIQEAKDKLDNLQQWVISLGNYYTFVIAAHGNELAAVFEDGEKTFNFKGKDAMAICLTNVFCKQVTDYLESKMNNEKQPNEQANDQDKIYLISLDKGYHYDFDNYAESWDDAMKLGEKLVVENFFYPNLEVIRVEPFPEEKDTWMVVSTDELVCMTFTVKGIAKYKPE